MNQFTLCMDTVNCQEGMGKSISIREIVMWCSFTNRFTHLNPLKGMGHQNNTIKLSKDET